MELPEGIRIGHASGQSTGVTVVLCPEGAVGGVDVRGGAAGTRELDPCRPDHLVRRVHGICLAGGSAFGLAAAGGVMGYLEEHGAGFPPRRVFPHKVQATDSTIVLLPAPLSPVMRTMPF